MIQIQQEDFSMGAEYDALRTQASGDGAIVTFTGLVREFNDDASVSSMFIEHYPGMTEKSLMNICNQAKQRWNLGQIKIIHRVGMLEACEQIVFVGVTSRHRNDAFTAAQFIMDHLKNDAPLWKKEGNPKAMKWVATKASDKAALANWSK
ncbi:molybdopterin synthase catalytic subunit MoaE [Glaciecola siphonariae]|uniref:Molybdopterin synthase catalytic subunit n=1 Tax=Glaciecola siphonariae TaxID=521012 RepID=A0ABV9LVW4_9ALTE